MAPRILLYTLSTCGHCKKTKSFLAEKNVTYDSVDVDLLKGQERQDMIEKVKGINPRCSFPTIVIGDVVIVGFKEDEIQTALAEAGKV